MLVEHLNKERIQKFTQKGHSTCIYQNEVDKTCFQRDMPYEDFKGLPRRMTSDNILCNKALILLKT